MVHDPNTAAHRNRPRSHVTTITPMTLSAWVRSALGIPEQPQWLIPQQGNKADRRPLNRAQSAIARGEHHRLGPYDGIMHPSEEQAIRGARARLS
jgi:hypothetical protein